MTSPPTANLKKAYYQRKRKRKKFCCSQNEKKDSFSPPERGKQEKCLSALVPSLEKRRCIEEET
jgi:hypothetical protein